MVSVSRLAGPLQLGQVVSVRRTAQRATAIRRWGRMSRSSGSTTGRSSLLTGTMPHSLQWIMGIGARPNSVAVKCPSP